MAGSEPASPKMIRSQRSSSAGHLEAPAGMPDTSVYDLGNRWFSERASVYRKFTVVHATIAMHFNKYWSRAETEGSLR
jgi:hypothetical protein